MTKIIKFILLILLSAGTTFGQIRKVKINKKLERKEKRERREERKLEKKEEKITLKYRKNIFRKEYKTDNYPKFIGTIIVKDSNTIKFDERILIIPDDIKEEYKLIFTEGIFYPKIDILRIGHFEELISLSPNYKTKRFLIWIFSPHIMNPTEWYFEIKNPNATKNMTTSDFIKGSLLTFYKQGGLII